jgi:hypothetical protein
MAKLAPLLLAVLPACLADVPDEPIGDAVEPGIHYGNAGDSAGDKALRAWLNSHRGLCAQGCLAAAARSCPWDQVCDDTDFVDCAGVTLTCPEAESAGSGGLAGLSECWEKCELARSEGAQ